MLSTLDGSKDILLFAFKSHANLVINNSCILLYLSKALYIEWNHRLQELLLGELIQGSIIWLVTKKLVIPFSCVTYLLLAYSISALWVPTTRALQISPDIHPLNQHHILCYPPWPTYLWLEYGDDTSQEGASKGRFKFPLRHLVPTLTPLPLWSGQANV
jgi:hypothetical protein